MITDLETLLNQDEFKNLVDAINKNQEYYLSSNGLTIKAESLDDDLFIDVCEYLGESELNKIQECLESGKLESVRAGITKFRMALSNVVTMKIEQLKAYV